MLQTIYIVNFDKTGPHCAYTDIDQAKAALWNSYVENHLPNFPLTKRAWWMLEDQETLCEAGYIRNYGYITSLPLNDEKAEYKE